MDTIKLGHDSPQQSRKIVSPNPGRKGHDWKIRMNLRSIKVTLEEEDTYYNDGPSAGIKEQVDGRSTQVSRRATYQVKKCLLVREKEGELIFTLNVTPILDSNRVKDFFLRQQPPYSP